MKYLKLFEEQQSFNDIEGFERISPIVESSLFSVYEIKSETDLKRYTSDDFYYNIVKSLSISKGKLLGSIKIDSLNDIFKYKNFILIPKFKSEKLGKIFVNFDAIFYMGEFHDDVDIYHLLKLPQNKNLFNYFNKLWKDDIIRVYHLEYDPDCLTESMGPYDINSYGDGYKYVQDSKGVTYIVFGELSDLKDFFTSPDLYDNIVNYDIDHFYSDLSFDHFYQDFEVDKDKYPDIYNSIVNIIEDFISGEDLDDDSIEDIRECIGSTQIDLKDLYKVARNYNIYSIIDPLNMSISSADGDAKTQSFYDDVVDKLYDHFGGMEFIKDDELDKLFPNLNNGESRYKYNMGIKITDSNFDPYWIVENRKDNFYREIYNPDDILDILSIDDNGYCDDYSKPDELDYEDNEALIDIDYEYSEPDYDIDEDNFLNILEENL